MIVKLKPNKVANCSLGVTALQQTYLWGSIIGTPTTCLQKVTITHYIAQTKISNLHITFGVKKQVLRLEISVNYHIPVAVLHTRDNLFHEGEFPTA